MPTIDWNHKVWGRDYAWPKDGDEWTEMADFSGVSYEAWKESLARTFLISNLREHFNVVEIGPGHGRWSVMIPGRIPKGTLWLVDLNASCIEFCKKRLAEHKNVGYIVTLGDSLIQLKSEATDFIWSFDTFVHIEEREAKGYAREMFRVLSRQGMGVIHHCGSPTPEQKAGGVRSDVTGARFKKILVDAGFYVIRQTDSWEGGNVRMAGDLITVFVKP